MYVFFLSLMSYNSHHKSRDRRARNGAGAEALAMPRRLFCFAYSPRRTRRRGSSGVDRNLPRGSQRFGFENHFRAGGFSDLGYGLGLLLIRYA